MGGKRGRRNIPAEYVAEHIEWLRSFNYSNLAIARELGISEKAIERRRFERKPREGTSDERTNDNQDLQRAG